MKTSNKLIITLALTIFLVPLGILLYQSRYYVPQETRTQTDAPLVFADTVEGYKNVKLPAFNAVQLNGSDIAFKMVLVKDVNFGLRVHDRKSKNVSAKVVNNVLHLTIEQGEDYKRHFYDLVVFAPNIAEISASNIGSLSLSGEMPALKLNIRNAKSLGFDEESKFADLTIHATDVKSIDLENSKVKRLSGNFQNAHLNSFDANYDEVNLNASNTNILFGLSEEAIRDNNKSVGEIGRFNIITKGKSELSVSVKVKEITGQLSDSTSIQMPFSYTRRLAHNP